MMKTIGFIDYYLSEWHANNYPEWIRNASAEMGEDFEVKYAWAELDVSPLDGVSSDEWCKANGVIKCDSVAELCEKADYILILAPSDPDKHLAYAKEVLKYKKNTYIDKTFAPDYDTAKRIFDIAKENGTPFFSSSALRYATELSELGDAVSVITTGGGSNLDEYIIHQVEMAVKLMKGAKPLRVRVEAQGASQRVCCVEFEGGKRATLIFAPRYGFAVNVDDAEGNNTNKAISSNFFGGLICDILRFYLSGVTSFDTKETLDVMKIREAIIKGKEKLGEWAEIVL